MVAAYVSFFDANDRLCPFTDGTGAVLTEPPPEEARISIEGAQKQAGEPAARVNPLRLYPSLSGGETIRRIGRVCLDQIAANQAGALQGSVHGIHQMRVAIRRLRAVLSAFGKLLPKAQRQSFNAELRWVGEVLGEARNLDVFETTLAKGIEANPTAAEPLGPVREAVKSARARAHEAVRRCVKSARLAALRRNLAEWFDELGSSEPALQGAWSRPIGELAPDILDRRRRTAKKLSKGFDRQDDDHRHQLRIALKKLRYASELLGDLYDPPEVEKFIDRLKRLQDDLGDANDVRVEHELLEDLLPDGQHPGAKQAAAAMLRRREHDLADHEPRLRKHLERLLEAQPFWAD